MIFNGSNQGTFASGSVQDRLNQERCCALAIRAGNAGTGQALRRTFVEICAQSRQCASSMWHLRPGNSGLHPARVVLNPADACIATLGEDFCALKEMLERHWMEL